MASRYQLAGWREQDDESVGGQFSNLRRVLAPEYAELSDGDLERVFESALGESSAENLESFWSQVKKIGGTAGGYLKGALPGMVQGATAGAALGPVGIIGGALAGGALNVAQQAGAPRGGNGARRPGPVGPAMPGGVPSVPLPVGGSPAAGQLLNLLARPDLLQSLLSMALGPAGKRSVRVGQTPVPVGAFTNLLGVLSNQAAAEFHAATAGEATGTPAYLLDDAGEFICDPANPIERAEALLELILEDDESQGEPAPQWDPIDQPQPQRHRLNRVYDEIELAEMYASGDMEY